MSDDPYDFDIAIPVTTDDRKKNKQSNHAYNKNSTRKGNTTSSGDDNSDGSIELSDSDDNGKQPARVATIKSKPITAVGGSNVLDKAKDFLSKYTAKSGTLPSRDNRRISLDSDDDSDSKFSLSSSGEERPSKSKALKSKTKDSWKKLKSQTKDSVKNFETGKGRKNPNDSEASADEGQTKTMIETRRPTVFSEQVKLAYNTEEVKKENSTTTETAASVKTLNSSMPWDAKKEDDVESIDSQSDAMDSLITDTVLKLSTSVSKPTGRPIEPTIPSAADSGMYEDEDFEDDEEDHAKLTVSITHQNNEYSMDFAMEGRESQEQNSPLVVGSDGDESLHHSAFLDEEESESSTDRRRREEEEERIDQENERRWLDERNKLQVEDNDEEEDSPTPVEKSIRLSLEREENSPAPVTKSTPVPLEVSTTLAHISNAVSMTGKSCAFTTLNAGDPGTTSISSQQTATSSTQPLPDSPPHVLKELSRPRVQIIRDYDQRVVEKRDASTQCTGNHAAVQTELIPEGMHNLHAPPQQYPNLSVSETMDPPLPTQPPSVPTSTSAHLSQLMPPYPTPLNVPYMAQSTVSTYKQQLMALQQQIQQKKHQTQLLFRERIAYRYSSLDNTEQFLASNRPARMPLWEALMKVDPTLAEAKAKEVAQLVTEGGFSSSSEAA